MVIRYYYLLSFDIAHKNMAEVKIKKCKGEKI